MCRERVNRGDARWSNFEPCGRPVKDDGLCGLHLSVRRRRAERDAAGNARRQRDEELQREAERLGATLGIEVTLEYNAFRDGGGYTGDFVVPADWLREKAAESS